MPDKRAVKGVVVHYCPLCGGPETSPYSRDDRREFLECRACGLVFVPSRYFLAPEEEHKRYDLHRNSPDDEGYLRFLGRLVAPLRERVPAGGRGLDFGSGPSPVLTRLLEQAGYPMTRFDLYYAADRHALERQYDFIAACEVLEHLREPGAELARLWSCLKPRGWLGIMTKLVAGPEEFSGWHYKNDLTHICFYSAGTFAWLAEKWKAELSFPERDVALFRKTTNEDI